MVDAVLKFDAPGGPCWRRYNHDGYGQRDDGGPFEGWGRGRPWPLLTGERGHYELAARRDVAPYIRAMEKFANSTAMLPEQIWDEPDNLEFMQYLGKATGSAMPLMWAHAEYIKLLRSAADGQVFDLIPEVAEHYRTLRPRIQLEVWKPNRRIRTIPAGVRLRIIAPAPFMLHWSFGEWTAVTDTHSNPTGLGLDFVDIEVNPGQRGPIRFTFFWVGDQRWEGRDYTVEIKPTT